MEKIRILFVALVSSLLSFSALAFDVTGNPNGSITITKYFDYECPHCRHLEPTVKQIIAENPDVKVISRVVPLLGKDSWYVARAVTASKKDGKWVEFNALLMNHKGFISSADVDFLAQDNLGYADGQLQKYMMSSAVTNELNANLDAAKSDGVSRIPTMIIQNAKGKRVVILGAKSVSDLNKIISEFRS